MSASTHSSPPDTHHASAPPIAHVVSPVGHPGLSSPLVKKDPTTAPAAAAAGGQGDVTVTTPTTANQHHQQQETMQPFPCQPRHPPLPLVTPTIGIVPGAAPIGASLTLTPSSIYSTNLNAIASVNLAALTSSEIVFKAKLALQAERYEEMAYFMRILVLQKSSVLSLEERGLFALAYKKLLGARRMGWRYIYSIEMKEKAAARKIETEIARETEKEARDRELAAKSKEEKSAESDTNTTDEVKSKPSSVAPISTSTTISAPASAPSAIPTLQSRLAALTTNLQHIHSYRYQLFYESSLLISEVSSLLLERLLPKLLTQHTQSEDVFTRWIPALIEQLITWERKRTGRPKAAGVPIQQPAKEKQPNTASAAAVESGLTPLLAALPVSSTSSSGPTFTKLDTSRHWSFEAEFELQLKALDERTRFLSSLRGVHADSLVFYCKMMADHRRLLAEFLAERDYEETERVNQSLQALAWYVLARFLAQPTLPPSHPVRLGLHLNFACFYYEVLAKPDRACQMASQTYDLALNEWQNRQAREQGAPVISGGQPAPVTSAASNNPNNPNNSSSEANSSALAAGAVAGTYKDSLLIMQLLKNNLTMWAQSL